MNELVDVGDEIANFSLESQLGRISYHEAINGRWGVMVTFGLAFDPVATTDLGMLARLADEFEARNISLLAVGNDSVMNYRRWIKDIEELNSIKVNYPIMSDPDMRILRQFGCARLTPPLGEPKLTCNGIFVVDIDMRLRSSMKYSTSVGRNMYEVLRLYDALQLCVHHKVVTPSNWGMGQDVLLHNDVSAEEAAHMRFAKIKPWFRLTPCPENENK